MGRKRDMQTEEGIASLNLRRAAHEHAMAKRAMAPFQKVKWAGDKDDPQWQAYIKVQHALFSAERRRRNLDALVKRDDDGWSRRLGFDTYGNLIIDGDWICILDGGTDEVCVNCARKMLLAGELDPDNAWAYLLCVDQPEYSVRCAECDYELWHVDDEDDEE